MEAMADATWNTACDRYSVVLTFNGAIIACAVKSIRGIMGCSAESEGYASLKASEIVEEAMESARAFGVYKGAPVVLGSDSVANLQIARRQGAASRLKHALRRWEILMERVEHKKIKLVHVGDAEMPADFLTKWVPAKKLEKSLDYVTNRKNRLAHPME